MGEVGGEGAIGEVGGEIALSGEDRSSSSDMIEK